MKEPSGCDWLCFLFKHKGLTDRTEVDRVYRKHQKLLLARWPSSRQGLCLTTRNDRSTCPASGETVQPLFRQVGRDQLGLALCGDYSADRRVPGYLDVWSRRADAGQYGRCGTEGDKGVPAGGSIRKIVRAIPNEPD
jgi:hypothetical protein